MKSNLIIILLLPLMLQFYPPSGNNGTDAEPIFLPPQGRGKIVKKDNINGVSFDGALMLMDPIAVMSGGVAIDTLSPGTVLNYYDESVQSITPASLSVSGSGSSSTINLSGGQVISIEPIPVTKRIDGVRVTVYHANIITSSSSTR